MTDTTTLLVAERDHELRDHCSMTRPWRCGCCASCARGTRSPRASTQPYR
jgi:hypothetical protein